jgi:hypothetical protein
VWSQLSEREVEPEYGNSRCTEGIRHRNEERGFAVSSGTMGKNKTVARGIRRRVEEAAYGRLSGSFVDVRNYQAYAPYIDYR